MPVLTSRGPVLVHFFDFAQLNSVRALPYVVEWSRRYAPMGLTTLGVHSPRYPFTTGAGAVASAARNLGIRHPVAVDDDYAVWHDYGCEGWPSLFLWGRGGVLRWFHFGEGDYEGTEHAIQRELGELPRAGEMPPPMMSLRATDEPGALVTAPTPEVLPGGSVSEPWTGGSEELVVEFAAGGAYAAVDGEGELAVRIDAGEPQVRRVTHPGLVELHASERHAEHVLSMRAQPGVRVWAISFAAGVP